MSILKERVAEYRRLVVSDVSQAALDSSIALIERIARLTINLPEIERTVAESAHEETLEEENRRVLSETLKEYMRSSFEDAHLHRRIKRDLLRIQKRILRVVVAVSVPQFLSGIQTELSNAEHSLILDTALIVFHQAYFGLLPEIPNALSNEKQLLLNSFLEFSKGIPRISDRERIRALVHLFKDDWVLASHYFRQALKATPPDEHEFMTILQTVWSHAIEKHKFNEASSILMENAHRVGTQDMKELEEMLLETLSLR